MGLKMRIDDGSSYKRKSLTGDLRVHYQENSPFVEIRDPHEEQSDVFIIHEDNIVYIRRVEDNLL